MTRKAKISKRFSEAARYYHDRAAVQREIAHDTAKLLSSGTLTGRCIDLGCGTGFLSAQLAGENPGLTVIGVDVALGMIELAERTYSGLQNLSFVCADCTEALPDGSVDYVVSSSSLQWMYPFGNTLSRWSEAIAPAGKMVLSFMIPGTLAEIKAARELVAGYTTPENLPELSQIVSLLNQTEMALSTSFSRSYFATFRTADALLEDLRSLGVTAPLREEPERKMTPDELCSLKRELDAMRNQNDEISLTYEVGFVVAEKRS